MALQTITRMALGGSLKLIRLPVDTVVSVGGDRASVSSLGIAVDRADAAIRGIVGAALNDEVLQDDARRRTQAADARKYALNLRAEAEERSERADERVVQRQQESDQRRARARANAAQEQQRARSRREATKKQAAKTASRRKQAAKKSAARNEASIEERAKPARLAKLDVTAEALDDREAALNAADEVRRLREEASKAKAARKDSA